MNTAPPVILIGGDDKSLPGSDCSATGQSRLRVHDGIPLDNVVECLELGAKSTRGNVLNLRGEALPFIRLRDCFEVNAPPPLTGTLSIRDV